MNKKPTERNWDEIDSPIFYPHDGIYGPAKIVGERTDENGDIITLIQYQNFSYVYEYDKDDDEP